MRSPHIPLKAGGSIPGTGPVIGRWLKARRQRWRIHMKTIKFLTAAVVATGLMATPVLAKDQAKHRAKAQADYSAQMSDSTYRDNGYRTGMRTSDSGFWPGDVAAGAVGGAVGIAGAAVS